MDRSQLGRAAGRIAGQALNPAYYDTGIVLKLYTEEPESACIRTLVRERGLALYVSGLHLCEAISALRLKQFRNECTRQQDDLAIACIEDDLRKRILRMAPLDWPAVWLRSQMLARTETGRTGTRTLDTLHVACALSLHAVEFITTDLRQAALAETCGLSVLNPIR